MRAADPRALRPFGHSIESPRPGASSIGWRKLLARALLTCAGWATAPRGGAWMGRERILPARRQREHEALLLRSAESLGRMIGSLQRQLESASRRAAANGHTPPRTNGNGRPRV